MKVKDKKEKRVKAAKSAKVTKEIKNAASGQLIKPAPRTGPVLTVRMRTEKAMNAVRGAAKKTGLTINTWATEVLEQAAAQQLAA